jgi:DNA-binding transcriptional ArsR family regulator
MRYTSAAIDAQTVTQTLTQSLEVCLSSRALTLFRVLHQISLEVAAARGYSPKVSQVSFFCPVEAVALALGVHRSTVYRALAELRALGLVDERAHFTTYRGRTVADGAVWCVRTRPLEGRAARIQYGDLKRQYRDLGRDVKAKTTVWAAMEQSKAFPSNEGVNLNQIRIWALPPTHKAPDVSLDCRMNARHSLEAVLDVKHVPKDDRSAAVDLAAEALAMALRDRDGLNFYRKLLWQLLRRFDATGEDHSYSVYLAAVRARTDALEGFARKPGALFVSRLKRAPWFDEVMTGPPRRVATKPLEA